MNPLVAAVILGAVKSAPVVVAGIENLSKEADSVTKQKLAIDSLHVLTGTAATVLPDQAGLLEELDNIFAGLINLSVATFNATGLFHHKAA